MKKPGPSASKGAAAFRWGALQDRKRRWCSSRGKALTLLGRINGHMWRTDSNLQTDLWTAAVIRMSLCAHTPPTEWLNEKWISSWFIFIRGGAARRRCCFFPEGFRYVIACHLSTPSIKMTDIFQILKKKQKKQDEYSTLCFSLS